MAKPSRETSLLSPFEQALDRDWRDWTTRRVYADWLEERDQYALAFAQRWMAAHELAPAWRVSYMGPRVTKPWAWYPQENATEELAPLHSRLPYPLYVALLGTQFFVGHRLYRLRIQAERELAETLEVLRSLLVTERK